MIYPRDLLDLVIIPTLQTLGKVDAGQWSQSAEQLLLGTAITESVIGNNMMLKQVQGPALGIFQIEPETHSDIWRNWLQFRRELRQAIWVINAQSETALTYNLRYSCAIARQVYRRSPDPLPEAGNSGAMSRCWKKTYNTKLGKGDEKIFARNFSEYVLPLYR